jgi:hypothetical protein
MHLPAKAVEWRQLCAIARQMLEQDPTSDDAEWKARILDRLVRLGFMDPDRQTLSRAMSAVERAHEKQHGPRQIPEPSTPSPPRPMGGPLNHRESIAFKAHLESLGMPIAMRTMEKPCDESSRTREQIHEWQQEPGLKAQVENRANPWIKTAKGWKPPARPSSDSPSPNSNESSRDE